ncbi:MAG: hypothetical protein V2I40_06275 [Desulfobacteraceae bacterium]|jgi:hypothetical protein|nr:hypothetical protein [Desulfobacteraceae bacterium]
MDIQWVLQMPPQMSESAKTPPTALVLRAGDLLTASVLEVEKGSDALLSIGSFRAYARLPLPVVTGQDIRIRVESAGETLRMVMVPENGHSASDPDGRRLVIQLFDGISDPPPLSSQGQPGAARQSPAHHAQPELISGRPIQSSTVATDGSPPPTVPEMAALRTLVQCLLEGRIQLEKNPSASLPTLTKGALINLQQALRPASSNGDMATLVARIRDFVENSGVYFEKRLERAILGLQIRPGSMPPAELARQPAIRDIMINDLKPNLLILKAFLDAQPPDPRGEDRHLLETLRSVVQRAVSHIAQQQFMAAEKPVDPDLFQAFSHLLFLTDAHRNARLKVYYAKKGRDDAHKTPRVSLLLDLDRMGTVRTDLWMVGKDLNVTLFVTQTDLKAAIESEHHRIGEMLRDTFNTVAVSVVVNQKKITEFEGEDLTLSQRRQVDLSI